MDYATYVMPFTRERIKVRVLGQAIRNGKPKIHILLPYKGWDLWVPVTRVTFA